MTSLDNCICNKCKHYEGNEGECYPEEQLMGTECEFYEGINEED